jgi:hypothetical protein
MPYSALSGFAFWWDNAALPQPIKEFTTERTEDTEKRRREQEA